MCVRSNHPLETVMPLAAATDLTVNDRDHDADVDAVAQDILAKGPYADATVLLCWRHASIPALATALGAKPPYSHWPIWLYDRVWQLPYPAGWQPPATLPIADIPQQLLFGDSIDAVG